MAQSMSRTVDPIVKGQTLPMSYEEFLALPDSIHAEWVDGEVTIFMPPTIEHQDALGLLHILLDLYARTLRLGKVVISPFEVVIRPGRSYREPDLLFVATANLARLTSKRLTGPPDLAIEFISDDSVRRDRDVKRREYQEAGLPEYWIFDPRPARHQALFYRLNAQGAYDAIAPDAAGRLHSTVLPGFWLKPEWVWDAAAQDPLALLAEIAPSHFGAR